MDLTHSEIILRAAVRWKGGVWSLPAPRRHGDVLMFMDEMFASSEPGMDGEQGFLTSHGRFVGRRIAYRIAVNAGQFGNGPGGGPDQRDELYSEDVW